MTLTKAEAQEAQATRDLCVEALLELKAEDIQVFDLTGIADFTDYFVICSGGSDTHVKAIADAVLEGLKEQGQRPWHREGYDSRKWVLLDYVDVVIHIFQREVREFYALERLWADAPVEFIRDEPSEDNAPPRGGASPVQGASTDEGASTDDGDEEA